MAQRPDDIPSTPDFTNPPAGYEWIDLGDGRMLLQRRPDQSTGEADQPPVSQPVAAQPPGQPVVPTATPTGGGGGGGGGGQNIVPTTTPTPTGGGGGGITPLAASPRPQVDPNRPFELTPRPSTVTPVELNLNGATLLRVTKPGADRWYVEYQAFGVTLRYEIGDKAAFRALGEQEWPAMLTVKWSEFVNREGLDVGLIDERFGIRETPQQTVRRQLEVFGQEDLPAWQTASKEVMTILLQASLEGWSPGRTFGLVSQTQAFAQEFPHFSEVQGLLGGTTGQAAFDYYIKSRDQIRDSIQAWRGPASAATNEYIGQLMSTGWDSTEVESVLKGEAALRQLPGAVDELNSLLQFHQINKTVGPETVLDLILGGTQTPSELREVINDALRSQAFTNQGVELSPSLAAALGRGESFDILSPESLTQIASETATNIFRFGLEIQAEREGITRDDIITAMVNGDNSAGVMEKLNKFARRRSIEAGGSSAGTSYQDQAGQLRILSLNSL